MAPATAPAPASGHHRMAEPLQAIMVTKIRHKSIMAELCGSIFSSTRIGTSGSAGLSRPYHSDFFLSLSRSSISAVQSMTENFASSDGCSENAPPAK